MKHKLFYLLSVVVTLPLWLSCSGEPIAPYPIPDASSSRAYIGLSIADSMGNDVFRTIPFTPEEVKDSSLSIKAQVFLGNFPLASKLYFTGSSGGADFPDTVNRKRLYFEFGDKAAYEKSDEAPFQRTYRLKVRIPQLFLDKEYHFIDFTCVYDKQKMTLLSATFEGKELLVKSYPSAKEEHSFIRGEGLIHLVYTPKRK